MTKACWTLKQNLYLVRMLMLAFLRKTKKF